MNTLSKKLLPFVLLAPLFLTQCGGGGAANLKQLGTQGSTVFSAVALRSKEAILLKQRLNQVAMKISILESASPSMLKSMTRARSIASAVQSVANNLVGVMPRNIDVQQFAHFSQIIGQNYWKYAFIPVTMAQMIRFQASYTNLLIHYMGQVIGKMRQADIKNLLAVLQTSISTLSGVAV